MRWFRVITWGGTSEDAFMGDHVDLKGCDDSLFSKGEIFKGAWDDSAYLQATEPKYDGNPSDVLPASVFLLIFSTRLKYALEKADIDGIQYLPINVFRRDGTPLKGYAIANIINLVLAIDWDKTPHQIDEDDPSRSKKKLLDFYHVALNHSVLEGYHIIRLKEDPFMVFVSDFFRKVFEDSGFTGYSFNETWVSYPDHSRNLTLPFDFE